MLLCLDEARSFLDSHPEAARLINDIVRCGRSTKVRTDPVLPLLADGRQYATLTELLAAIERRSG